MASPVFSVVTVTLNCVDDAESTAKSVLAQDFTDYEYIVKDGGSTDGTCERLRDLGIANVIVSPDAGIYDAMNQALALCRGEYVYFLNAGDTFPSHSVLSEAALQLDPNAAIVYGEVLYLPMRKQTRHPSRLTRYYLFRKNVNHQAFLAQLSVYQSLGGFDLRYRYNADQHFLRRVVLQKRLPAQHIDVILARWPYGGDSTHPSSRRRNSEERWRMLLEFYTPLEMVAYGAASLYFLNNLKYRIAQLRYAYDAEHGFEHERHH